MPQRQPTTTVDQGRPIFQPTHPLAYHSHPGLSLFARVARALVAMAGAGAVLRTCLVAILIISDCNSASAPPSRVFAPQAEGSDGTGFCCSNNGLPVLVVGAGVSGLTTAKVLQENGCKVGVLAHGARQRCLRGGQLAALLCAVPHAMGCIPLYSPAASAPLNRWSMYVLTRTPYTSPALYIALRHYCISFRCRSVPFTYPLLLR